MSDRILRASLLVLGLLAVGVVVTVPVAPSVAALLASLGSVLSLLGAVVAFRLDARRSRRVDG